MKNKNLWLIHTKQDPIKGQLILRHIWKGTSNECRSLWRFNEDVVIDGTRQYTTLNGSFRDVYTSFKAQYLYVTSKDPYQKGDWVKNVTIEAEPPFKLDVHGIRYTQISPCKFEKVVLTTDRYLIADGVQVVPDEFLEWFVKNPSCEWVEVEKDRVFRLDEFRQREFYNNYKIIIPQEEVRQELEKEMFELEQELDIPSNLRWHNSKPKQELERGITITHVGKQETLEQVAERILANNIDGLRDALKDDDLFFFYKGVIQCYGEAMAEWQQQNSYSEADMIESSKYGYNFHKTTQFPEQDFEDSCIRNTQQWLTKFKKETRC